MSDKPILIRIRWARRGGHTHVSFWSGKFPGVNLGQIIMLNEEFDAWHDGEAVFEFTEDPE